MYGMESNGWLVYSASFLHVDKTNSKVCTESMLLSIVDLINILSCSKGVLKWFIK